MSTDASIGKPLALHAGWLVDGSGGPIQQNVIITVRDGRIAGIDRPGPPAFRNPDPLDMTGCTLLPGMVDSHVHVFMSGAGDPTVREHQLKAGYTEIRDVITRHLAQHLASGVAAVRDGGDWDAHALQYKREPGNGSETAVKLRVAGKAWRNNGRYGRLVGRPPAPGQDLAAAIQACPEGIDHVKIINSGLNSLTEYHRETPPQFDPGEMRAAVSAANRKGLKTMVHANGRLPVKIAIAAGCSSVEHGFFMGTENLKAMADRQVAWVPTAFTMLAYARLLKKNSKEAGMARKNFDHQLEQLARARQCGVPVVLGTDAGSLGVHHGAAVRQELAILIQTGFSVPEAVQCATTNGARLLGLEETGALKPGRPATFIAVDGDPSTLTESLAQIRQFWVAGQPTIESRIQKTGNGQ